MAIQHRPQQQRQNSDVLRKLARGMAAVVQLSCSGCSHGITTRNGLGTSNPGLGTKVSSFPGRY